MIPSGVKVFLASHPIDFRKGPDSLLSLVRDAGSDPFNGALYVFRAIPPSDSGQPDDFIVLIILIKLRAAIDDTLHPYPHGFRG
ncbi:IS66 family insertion sequence element accessory protein TnpB [Rhizobium leguminosarum]|uniref:IS66 family insertion sequence element accessory protein TnpB n=1 Tax=Rhizobium leguminosarum TaxID=384 RepID=UPI003D03D0D0